MPGKTDYINRVKILVKDPKPRFTVSGTGEVAQLVDAAARTYSKQRPLVRIHTVSGDGQKTYFDLPASWQIGFSTIVLAEHPVSSTPVSYIEGTDLDAELEVVKVSDTTERLHTKRVTLAASGTSQHLKLHYTAPHVIGSSTTTVPDNDFDALCFLAASYLASALAGFYADDIDPSLKADSVDFRSKAAEYRALAKEYLKRYQEHVGADEDGHPAALLYNEEDIRTSWDSELLFHRRRRF